MTKLEFSEILNFLAFGCRQDLSTGTIAAYYEMLGDLPPDVFRNACRSVLAEHVYNSLPSIAQLRQAAVNAQRPAPQLTAGEAWALAWDAAARIDPDLNGPHRVYIGNGEYKEYNSQAESVLESIPAPVVQAMRVYGLRELCNASGPDGVIRAQFTKIFEQQTERDNRVALMPPSVRKVIDEKRDEDLVKKSLASIGDMPK